MEPVDNVPGFSIYSQTLQGNGEIWSHKAGGHL
jgi:hypothetical protein